MLIKSHVYDQSEGTYKEIKDFAHKHPNGKSFTQCIERLNDLAQQYSDAKCTIYKDFAPMSLYFVINNDHNPKLINGGVVFHGIHDGFGSGSAPTYSLSLDKTDGWQIHT